MRNRLTLIAFFALLLGFVRGNPDSGFPISAEVHPDRRITFRFIAKDAEKVEVKSRAIDGKGEMTKGEDGLWELTTGPVDADIYDYTFQVDGVTTLDPHNRWVKGWRRSSNLVLVPGETPKLWEPTAVPHGAVHQHLMHSEILKTEREVFVYTPPGYSESKEDFPVLFLLHGSGDDPSAWTNVGRAHLMADNLIAAGKMKPMVIVMPHGHGAMPGVDLRKLEKKDEWYVENSRAVKVDFFGTLLPYIHKNYRVSEDPKQRAVAGLSMGGGQSLYLGLNYPEQFGWVGGFSSGTPGNEKDLKHYFSEMPKDAQRELVWIACGKTDFLLERNEFFRKWLDDQGVKHTYKLTEGGHSWWVWRMYLEEFLPLLFQKG